MNFPVKELINKIHVNIELDFESVYGTREEDIYNLLKEEYERHKEIMKNRLMGEKVELGGKVYEKREKPKTKILVKRSKNFKEKEIFYKLMYGKEISFLRDWKNGDIEYWKGYMLAVLYKKLNKKEKVFLTKAPKEEIEELIYRDIGVLENKTYWEEKYNLIEILNQIPKTEKEYKEFTRMWEREIFKVLYFRPQWIRDIQEGLIFYLLSGELKGEDWLIVQEYYKQYEGEELTIYERKYKEYLKRLIKGENKTEEFLEDLEEYDIEIRIGLEAVEIEIEEEKWITRIGEGRMEIPKWVFDFVINEKGYDGCILKSLKEMAKAKRLYEYSELPEKVKEVYTKYKLLVED
jgi:hypothetical protein